MSADHYLDYCVKIARNGMSFVSPNPLVGAIIVHENKIIGEAWHSQFGAEHAERKAIKSVPTELIKGLPFSTLYVSLEPCNHSGKTPPCTDFIIQSGIKKVVIDSLDPNPKMRGKSVEILKKAGIQVEWRFDYNSRRKDDFNCSFIVNITDERPYIILKWAQSADGFIGKTNQSLKISNKISDVLVHKWRAESDGILVGRKTFEIDQPLLTTRYWDGKSPKKFILTKSNINTENWRNQNFELVNLDENVKDKLLFLYQKKNIGILLVEGGQDTLQYFINHNIWDEARVITNSKLFLNSGIKAPVVRGKIVRQFDLLNDRVSQIFHF